MKIKEFGVYILVLLLFVSCSKGFLDINPKGELFPQSFYSNEQELEMSVVALYDRAQLCYEYGYALCYGFGSPDKTSSYGPFLQPDVFAVQSDNYEMWNYWSLTWQVITAANEVILRYKDANAPEAKKQEVAGQAHFIRAYKYFMLVRQYNKLPLFTDIKELSVDMNLSEPEDIYRLIIDDLLIAEQYLPDNWDHDSKKKGVAWTSGAAKSLLAYVYLSMAGYPLNDTEKYALAAQKAKEVIDNAWKYGYRLMPNIADLYSKEYNYLNKACDEVVLAFHSEERFGCPLCGFPAEYSGWDLAWAEINFFESYPAGPRKDAIFMWEFPFEDGTKKPYTQMLGKHPFYKQYWDGKLDWEKPWLGMHWQNSRPQVAITHANTLLIYAEAQAMSASPDASAYDAVNQVRRRAGLNDLPAGLSQTAFRDSVALERMWEFCGSYFCTDPWYDLVRLERVEEAIQDRHPSEHPIQKTPTKRQYFAPYPANDVNKNPNLNW